MVFPHLMPMFSASNFEEPLGARVGGTGLRLVSPLTDENYDHPHGIGADGQVRCGGRSGRPWLVPERGETWRITQKSIGDTL